MITAEVHKTLRLVLMHHQVLQVQLAHPLIQHTLTLCNPFSLMTISQVTLSNFKGSHATRAIDHVANKSTRANRQCVYTRGIVFLTQTPELTSPKPCFVCKPYVIKNYSLCVYMISPYHPSIFLMLIFVLQVLDYMTHVGCCWINMNQG